MNIKDLKILAREMTKLQRQVLLSEPDIAEMCGYASGSAPIRELLEDPEFPAPRRLTETSHRRWIKKEVVAFLENRRENDISMILATAGI